MAYTLTQFGMFQRDDLNDLLRQFHSTRCQTYKEQIQQSRDRVQAVVDSVFEEVSKLDKRFRINPITGKTTVKVLSRDVFDAFIEIQGLEVKDVMIEDSQTPPGYTLVRMVKGTEGNTDWRDLCGTDKTDKEYVSARRVCDLLKGLVVQTLRKKFISCENLSVECISTAACLSLNIIHSSGCYFVNLVPELKLEGMWPYTGQLWKYEESDWPVKKVKKEILRDGVDLCARAALVESSYFWEISFTKAESKLFSGNIGVRQQCLDILSTILDTNLLYPRGLTTYHLETLILHQSKKFFLESYWSENNLGDRLLDFFHALHRSLKDFNCTHFFLPRYNLFNKIHPAHVQILDAKVKQICDNPHKFFELSTLQRKANKAINRSVSIKQNRNPVGTDMNGSGTHVKDLQGILKVNGKNDEASSPLTKTEVTPSERKESIRFEEPDKTERREEVKWEEDVPSDVTDVTATITETEKAGELTEEKISQIVETTRMQQEKEQEEDESQEDDKNIIDEDELTTKL